ncbi:MAG: NADH:ubiquinone reductase (Na(+)-transporting) subunit F [Gammaproteobacteria bacterium]|uniref:NADH:ubiquinone reductase (Na(+)-transporting) subunit F n=1 Tax=Bradyrhizobium sp. TaxID=376 RepID=UPI003D0F237B
MNFCVTLAPFGVQFECGADESILSAALRQGVGLRYGCKHGACGSCKAKIVEGEVDLTQASGFALMQFEREAGMALLCSAYPLEDVVVELTDYDEAELSAARPIVECDCRVSMRTRIAPDIWQLRLAVDGAKSFGFDAGQFIEVNVPGTDEWRAYSMANSPADGRALEFLIKELPGGRFSTFLAEEMCEGEVVRIRGPYGQFKVNQGTAPIVMVAGGSGMAPILSMLRTLAEQRSARNIVFFYGARTAKELICAEEIAHIAASLDSFTYIPVLSEPAEDSSWSGETGLVTAALERRSASLRAAEAYLCGPPGMIDAAIEVLKQKGMFSSRIRYDKFVSTGGRA